MIFIKNSLICWLSKKKTTIESSVFGAEFVAMKHGMENLRDLRYKLRMMGVPLSGPLFIYGDNMSVIYNIQRPESTLKKKCNSIYYHAMHESVAMRESITSHIRTLLKFSDLMNNVTSGQKQKNLVGRVMFDIYDHE